MRIFAIFFLSLACVTAAFSQTSLKIGEKAPAFSAYSLDGTSFDLNELRGSVVVLTFWSTKCAICHSEFPKLNRVIKGFEGKKVVFLSLTMEKDEKVEAYLKTTRLDSQILTDSFGILLQYADRDKEGNLDMGFPSYVVINDMGFIEYRSSGYDKTDSLNTAITHLISKL
ncbi:MAG: TlpA family protein disulfide reductase [Pyrinomonadaceae bacterium]